MVKAMTAEQRALVLDIIARNDSMTLATVRPDGFPQATIVTYVNDGLTLYVGTWESMQKVGNISKCNKVSGTIGNYDADWRKLHALSLGGTADLIRDAGEMVRIYRLIGQKFPQTSDYQMPDIGGGLVIRIKPFVISLLDYSKGFHHNELVSA